MVRHGRNKKRRAGRIGRTKLKNRNYTRWNPNPKIGDATVKKLWNVNKTPKQNLTMMGLTLLPNEHAIAGSSASGEEGCDNNNNKPNMIELFDIPESDSLTKQKKKKQFPLTKDEQDYMVKCMTKHAIDYQAMFRDTRVNTYQHTETQLQKMGARFLLLNTDQIKVSKPIPEKIKAKMEAFRETQPEEKEPEGE